MTLLAIDTSTQWGSVALFDGRRVLAEQTWFAERRHDDALFATTEGLLELSGLTLARVDRIAVAIGPGSFTGLRVGIAAAQGLARGSGASLLGVSTLDVVAHPWSTSRLRVCAVVPAGRGESYAAIYRHRGGEWTRTSAILVGNAQDLARHIGSETVIVGELDPAIAAGLRDLLGARAIWPPAASTPRRAGHLAEIAWQRFESGAATSAPIEPMYIQPPRIHGAAVVR